MNNKKQLNNQTKIRYFGFRNDKIKLIKETYDVDNGQIFTVDIRLENMWSGEKDLIKARFKNAGAEIEFNNGFEISIFLLDIKGCSTNSHLMIEVFKEYTFPDKFISRVEKTFGCSLFCENELSSKNIHFLFSGYMRNIQTEMKTKIPNDIQLLTASYGLPNHK